MPYFLPHYEHIPLHRLWTFATLQDDLSLPEHAHILDCEECRSALRACLKGDNFGGVLKGLREESEKAS